MRLGEVLSVGETAGRVGGERDRIEAFILVTIIEGIRRESAEVKVGRPGSSVGVDQAS